MRTFSCGFWHSGCSRVFTESITNGPTVSAVATMQLERWGNGGEFPGQQIGSVQNQAGAATRLEPAAQQAA